MPKVPQTRLSSQDSVEDPEAERPVSALPGHHNAVFEPSRAWPHPRTHRYFQRKIILISSYDNKIFNLFFILRRSAATD
ncbi:hypothetical protein RRG08_008202 [Elysia crispata]|uniref:Uncharacterized protein n=1 Tax=Elysia crispata TaxID=231223 RepID=A0AAE0YYI1_9GAST|nr:hypothetical protein RRG08_008202 [Elysia crispata]